jgi:LmbE family N-acetylglucosaminyl deacetylase
MSDLTKRTNLVLLRERETRAAWRVLAPGRHVPIEFLRGPDKGLVASSTLENGVRRDVLTQAGVSAYTRAVLSATRVPPSVRQILLISAARYDAHPDHRTAYYAARRSAEVLASRGFAVKLWTFIVHDEVAADLPGSLCCVGDVHWPGPGPKHDFALLTDSPARPRPPLPDRFERFTDDEAVARLRHDALSRHVSQVVGDPELCTLVFIPDFYERWSEKVEEPFYEEAP